jgi:hypothetical protein
MKLYGLGEILHLQLVENSRDVIADSLLRPLELTLDTLFNLLPANWAEQMTWIPR